MARIEPTAVLARARRLLDVMELHEEALAARVEAELFPDGVPFPLTLTDLIRAVARDLANAAEAMAVADIAHSRVEAKRRPNQRRTSLISPEVTVRLAHSAELEQLAMEHAADIGRKSEQRYFPDGHPPWRSVAEVLGAIRSAVTVGLAEASEMGDEAILRALDVVTAGTEKYVVGLAEVSGYERAREVVATLGATER